MLSTHSHLISPKPKIEFSKQLVIFRVPTWLLLLAKRLPRLLRLLRVPRQQDLRHHLHFQFQFRSISKISWNPGRACSPWRAVRWRGCSRREPCSGGSVGRGPRGRRPSTLSRPMWELWSWWSGYDIVVMLFMRLQNCCDDENMCFIKGLAPFTYTVKLWKICGHWQS